jgi:hypothetical protein
MTFESGAKLVLVQTNAFREGVVIQWWVLDFCL